VAQADEKVCIGPASSTESYLNSDAVLKAIRDTGAQAVHPGYGFMSENAVFSKQVTDMGVAWLGPSPSAVKDMGDKLTSKILAENAGVHIIPGYDGPLRDVQHALEVSNDIGYPILLKAASGGGGKGMRVCRSDADVLDAFPMATAEGLKFFKDPRLLCEKYVSDDCNALSTLLFTNLIQFDHSIHNHRSIILIISSFKSWRE
jgi:propionyl-CoA carboxylase alpha chain